MNSKTQRKIDNHLKILLGKSSLQSIPWEELKKINFIDQISREIDIGSRRLYLTEKALLSRNEIEALIINELSDLQSTANDIFQELKKSIAPHKKSESSNTICLKDN